MAEYIEREVALNCIKIARGNLSFAYEEITRLPTADVAPIVHAHVVVNWLGDCHCSNCGEYCDSAKPFCASCGARFDEPEMRED